MLSQRASCWFICVMSLQSYLVSHCLYHPTQRAVWSHSVGGSGCGLRRLCKQGVWLCVVPNAGSTRATFSLRWSNLHLAAASRSYTCAQDGLNTVQLVLVVFFLSSISANTPLTRTVVIVHCNLHWWCFSLEH